MLQYFLLFSNSEELQVRSFCPSVYHIHFKKFVFIICSSPSNEYPGHFWDVIQRVFVDKKTNNKIGIFLVLKSEIQTIYALTLIKYADRGNTWQ